MVKTTKESQAKAARERKQRLFKFLHNPISKWSHVYHAIVSTCICSYAIMLNFYKNFEEFKEEYEQMQRATTGNKSNNVAQVILASRPPPDYIVVTIDAILAAFLLIELALRFWSSTYIASYNNPRLKGIYAYFKAYRYRRMLDLLGILVYILSIIAKLSGFDQSVHTAIQIIQILQIYQANRILYPYMRVIFRTIFGYQSHYLLFCLFFSFMIITLSSTAIYLTEVNAQPAELNTIFETFWFIFETFSTIGYGEVVPKNWYSKFVVCILAVFGIFAFSLPSNIIGTTLSIKMTQDSRKSLRYRKAVRLIQTVWRCRISNLKSPKVKTNILLLRRTFTHPAIANLKKGKTTPNWTERDLLCIWFLMKTKFIMAGYRFKRQNINMSSYSDVSQQNDELWQRIDYIENDLAGLSSAIYECLHIRLASLRDAVDTIQKEIGLQSTVNSFAG